MIARILYIDDEEELLDLASCFFEDDDLPLETVSDFNAALELIRNNHYDLIISDAKMPSGSGFELLKIIRSEALFSGKIILVSGDLENKSECHQLGFDKVMYKPIVFQDLIQTVKELLIK